MFSRLKDDADGLVPKVGLLDHMHHSETISALGLEKKGLQDRNWIEERLSCIIDSIDRLTPDRLEWDDVAECLE